MYGGVVNYSQGVAVGRGLSVGGGVGQKLLVADFRGFK